MTHPPNIGLQRTARLRLAAAEAGSFAALKRCWPLVALTIVFCSSGCINVAARSAVDLTSSGVKVFQSFHPRFSDLYFASFDLHPQRQQATSVSKEWDREVIWSAMAATIDLSVHDTAGAEVFRFKGPIDTDHGWSLTDQTYDKRATMSVNLPMFRAKAFHRYVVSMAVTLASSASARYDPTISVHNAWAGP